MDIHERPRLLFILQKDVFINRHIFNLPTEKYLQRKELLLGMELIVDNVLFCRASTSIHCEDLKKNLLKKKTRNKPTLKLINFTCKARISFR